MANVAIVGAGMMGTATAYPLADNGHTIACTEPKTIPWQRAQMLLRTIAQNALAQKHPHINYVDMTATDHKGNTVKYIYKFTEERGE